MCCPSESHPPKINNVRAVQTNAIAFVPHDIVASGMSVHVKSPPNQNQTYGAGQTRVQI